MPKANVKRSWMLLTKWAKIVTNISKFSPNFVTNIDVIDSGSYLAFAYYSRVSTKLTHVKKLSILWKVVESGRNSQFRTKLILFSGKTKIFRIFENFFLIVLIFLIQIDVFSAHVFVTRLK